MEKNRRNNSVNNDSNSESGDFPDYGPINITYGTGFFEKVGSFFVRMLKNITVEPVAFFYALGFSVTMVISPNLYFDKVCKVSGG